MPANTPTAQAAFEALTPDVIIELAEDSFGRRFSNICRPLNSYINRVYEVIADDGEAFIVKIYRPGRWDRAALEDEHRFMAELVADEIPVIAPLADVDGETLRETDAVTYAAYRKKGGRIVDEPSEDEWRQLGRLFGRMHAVGSRSEAEHRVVMHPLEVSAEHLDFILDAGGMASDLEDAYEEVAGEILNAIAPRFDDETFIRIHGDCHVQNLIFRPDEGFYLIDFDDMAMGPAVQDLWMLLPGRAADCRRELDLFLGGYRMFRPFNNADLKLIEPLRAMRFLHYTAWCVHQVADGGFRRLSPDWGTDGYWRQEIHELHKQLDEIHDTIL